jgi:hypothetical protein
MTDVSLVYAFAAFNFPYEFSRKLVGENAPAATRTTLDSGSTTVAATTIARLPYSSTTAPAILHDHNGGSPNRQLCVN